ncbi:MAG: hypothetical protein HY209_08005 [Candidatus Omnitrophica bacterium]|nr:hypothetical protein [Candidatus Omnitrophota bacterium]
MIYLLLGEDTQAKDLKIAEIKSRLLTKPEAVHFDFESLDAHHLSAASLKKALLALPAFSSQRLVLIRHVHKLKNDVVTVLLPFVDKPPDYCDVILEASGELKGQLKEMPTGVKTWTLGVKEEANIFDMTRLMSAQKTTEALKMLHEFYSHGMYPLQMMGALVWYWGKEGRALGPQKFERGLKVLQEADLNIKRSRLLPEYALEKLVVELVELQK